jgi:hypothetical protein
MKQLIFLLSFLFVLSKPALAQHNPYLDKKAKNKPSAVMAKQGRKEMKKQKRVAKRQMRRSKKHINRKRR